MRPASDDDRDKVSERGDDLTVLTMKDDLFAALYVSLFFEASVMYLFFYNNFQ